MDELKDIVMTADEDGRIAWKDGNQLMCADLVVSGTDQNGDAIYVLAQISKTVQQQHVNQARGRARILQLATGVNTIAAVIGAAPIDGTDQNGDAIYVLAQISKTVQQQHVNQARGRARILQLATGVNTIAAVIGAAPIDGATPEDVHVILTPSKEELDANFHG